MLKFTPVPQNWVNAYKIRMIGLLIFLVGIVGAISCGWSEIFLNIPSVVYVVLVAGGLALIKFRKGNGVAGFLKHVKRYAIVSGILGMLTGVLQMASATSGTKTFDQAGIFVGFGTALLTVFYGLIVYCILDALEKTDV